MLKVLLIDDEYFIREGLKTIIDWNSYGYEVCGDSENGSDGLQKVRQLLPDLIIVDVKMPVMDGLEMVEELRRQGINCKVIILTAYSDFKFAHKSIELGIDRYLLKPIDPEELVKNIVEIRNEIKTERDIKHYMNRSMNLSRERIIEGLVTGTLPDIDECINNRLYGFDLPWKSYTICLLDTDRDLTEEIHLRSNIKTEADNIIQESGYGYVFYIKRFIGVLLKNMESSFFPQLLKGLQEKIHNKLGVSVIISLGETVEKHEDINQSYQVACRLMDRKFIYGHKKILMQSTTENDLAESTDSCTFSSLECFAAKLYDAVDINDPAQINDLLEGIKNRFTRNEVDEDTIKVYYTDLILTVLGRLPDGENSIKSTAFDKREFISDIYKKSSLADLHGYIKYKLISFSDLLSGVHSGNTMKKILNYIDRNYYRDIKLETLARLFNYNTTYLGKLFKCYTGQHFNTYLDHVRIEKAKFFLSEGFKVYQVVEKIGICDIDYFYKKFKKYTGVSPSYFKSKEQ